MGLWGYLLHPISFNSQTSNMIVLLNEKCSRDSQAVVVYYLAEIEIQLKINFGSDVGVETQLG